VHLELVADVIAAVKATPNPRGLPGSNVLQQLVNGAEAWALAIALLGAFVGAAVWAVASHSHNHHYAARGRMAALISAAAALVVGAAPGIVNFFERLGTTAK
jgi:Mn2+/Fe2+ NRAMP family transporter